MSRLVEKIVLGFLMCQLLAAPSSFAGAIGLEGRGDASQFSESMADGASAAAAGQMLAQTQAGTNLASIGSDTSSSRRAPRPAESDSTDTIGDDLLALSGPGVAALVITTGLLILAAVNTRKRPLRSNRSPTHGDR